jgi:predicted transglutaminase-like cysteine proteinase
MLSWQRMLESARSGNDREKLERVNRYFNALGFVSDTKHWGRSDYWATPVEFVNSGAGDCEDFAVAKYISLHRLGVSIDRLRLVYVLAVGRNEAHMVLGYFETPQAEPLILDNLVSEIRPSTLRKDLVPVYSFNDSGLWLVRRNGKSERVGNSSRLSAWTDLQKRILWASAKTN